MGRDNKNAQRYASKDGLETTTIMIIHKPESHISVDSEYRVGECFETGRGAIQNVYTAVYWFSRAKVHGHPKAIPAIARVLIANNDLLFESDTDKPTPDFDTARIIPSEPFEKIPGFVLRWLIEESPESIEIELLEGACRRGNELATRLMIKNYSAGKKKALKTLMESSQRGNQTARSYLSAYVESGDPSFIKMCAQEAYKGSIAALLHLFEAGKHGYSDAVDAIESGAKNSVPLAQFYLSELLTNGWGRPANVGDGLRWLFVAAKNGHLKAIRSLLDRADRDEEARQYFLQIMQSGDKNLFDVIADASCSGNAFARSALIESIKNGYQVSEDTRAFLTAKARHGGLDAAEMHVLTSSEVDEVVLLQVMVRTELGNQRERASALMLSIARKGVKIAFAHAAALARNGNADALACLISLWDRGHRELLDPIFECVRNGSDRAHAKLKESATSGDREVQKRLIAWYDENGASLSESAEALEWTKAFASSGEPWAQTRLGKHYSAGVVVPQDYVEALVWFRRAAQQDFCAACLELATAYTLGLGVAPNLSVASKWRERAERYKSK